VDGTRPDALVQRSILRRPFQPLGSILRRPFQPLDPTSLDPTPLDPAALREVGSRSAKSIVLPDPPAGFRTAHGFGPDPNRST
jgi:hypothetical protein